MRVVLSGAGSGFGLATARRLLDRGDAVVACDIDPDGLAARILDGREEGSDRLEIAPLDLRDPGTIQHAMRIARDGGEVHGLVNNAGYAVFGAQGEADLDSVHALFDANVVGTARVTQALLPALRAAKGVVVTLSSVAGRMAFPESGFYAGAKHALEAMSEALYVENCDVGLGVCVVEPGAFDTGFAARAARSSRPRDPDGAHGAQHALWDARKVAALAPPQDPDLVAATIVAALHGPRTFRRIRVGTDSQTLLSIRDALGEDAWVRFLASRVGGSLDDAGVPSPAQVLAADDLTLTEGAGAWLGLRRAASAGLLEHWSSGDARVARERLAALLDPQA